MNEQAYNHQYYLKNRKKILFHKREQGKSVITGRRASKVALAYVAGIVDGEGSIGLYRHKQGQIQAQVAIFNTDRRILDHICSALGGGITIHTECKPKRKPVYVLRWTSRKVIRKLLKLLLPYLVGKKERASIMLDWIERKEDSLVVEMSKLNKKGVNL